MYREGYIDLYFADASHFSLTPSVCYAGQKKNEQLQIPTARSIALSVFGLTTPDCKLYLQTFEGTSNSDKIIQLIDQFVEATVKQTVIAVDNAPVHHSKVFTAKIQQWSEHDVYVYFFLYFSLETPFQVVGLLLT